MQFWDASAIVPLLVRQAATDSLRTIRAGDPALLVWWGTVVECDSAIARLKRMGGLDQAGSGRAQAGLDELRNRGSRSNPATRFALRHAACSPNTN